MSLWENDQVSAMFAFLEWRTVWQLERCRWCMNSLMFFKDICDLLRDYEVEFVIDLVPGTIPI